jgi:acyl-CoA reductase-like NAD-dependent aldehyde dehydrogenase
MREETSMTDVAARPIDTDAAPERLRCMNPADGSLVAEYPIASDADVTAAVARARAAAPAWEALGSDGRERCLLRWAGYLVEHSDELVELVHAENGKPQDDAYLELVVALELIRWSARNAGKVLKSRNVNPGLLMANFAARVEYRPLGVVGVIGPWNYPLYTPTGTGAFALAAGNTVVFKPSEFTTAIGVFFAEAFAKANPDAPKGVLTAVTGYGATGASLSEAGVDKIAFTGSTATGKKIMASCAERLTPVVLECGGKDAFVVAEDADVAAAAKAAAWGGVSNSGQTCVGVERVYVVEPVRDQFLDALRKELVGISAGDAKDADYGPMTMPSQVDIVRRHVADAIAHGGSPLVGGLNSIRAPFIDPIVLVDTDESSAAVQEETFGPTLTVRTVRDVDEAVALANGTRYGLASTVFSKGRGVEIARRLRAGATSINAPLGFAAIPSLPFGGVGESGIGRIHGAEGLREFVRPHSIARQRYAIPGLAMLSFDRKPSVLRVMKKVVARRHGNR